MLVTTLFVSLLFAFVHGNSHRQHRHINSSSIIIQSPLPDHLVANWREGSRKSDNQQSFDNVNKPWLTHSKSVETPPIDSWLYDEYFYGRTGGVILESGGLDGTSYLNFVILMSSFCLSDTIC